MSSSRDGARPRNTEPEVKLGSTIWRFDDNVRARTDDNQRDYRACWVPIMIVGETARSWECGEGWKKRIKVPKKRAIGDFRRFAFSEQEVTDWVWWEKHRWNVGKLVSYQAPPAMGRQVAELIGYDPPGA
jgi:hypothetical protein